MANDFLLHRFTSRHADTSGSAFGVHPDGGMAALGSTEGIRVIDLNWPWEVNRVLQQPNTGGCAVLQWHPHVTVLLDEAAASRLELADYYRETWAHKPDWQGL